MVVFSDPWRWGGLEVPASLASRTTIWTAPFLGSKRSGDVVARLSRPGLYELPLSIFCYLIRIWDVKVYLDDVLERVRL